MGALVARSKEEKYGDATLRVMAAGDGFQGIIIRGRVQSAVMHDDDEQRLWTRLRNEAGTLHPSYVGFDGAIKRFTSFFPDGFRDPQFVARERQYKLEARAKLLAAAPLDNVLAGADFDIVALAKAFQTNMLSTFEAARVSQLLRSPQGHSFVAGAARLTSGEVEAGLKQMAGAVAPFGRASWPIVTYLPYLWQPDTQMFLKPEKTVDFAERVGHSFAHIYSADLEAEVYASVLEMAAETESKVASLHPADRIDIQSFIWVVGAYEESDRT